MSPSESQLWIEIPDWDRFQHYNDRRPPWIKNYTALLGDPNYLQLTLPQRGILSGLWLMYAESSCQVPANTAWIGRRLNGNVSRKTLEALNHAGFIRIVASKPLAPRYQSASARARPGAHRERETETETETQEQKQEQKMQVQELHYAARANDLKPIAETAAALLAGMQFSHAQELDDERGEP